nr:hypothetical protein [Halobaculum gomorrense]
MQSEHVEAVVVERERERPKGVGNVVERLFGRDVQAPFAGRTPASRNCMLSVDFPVPGPPRTSVACPRGSPPRSIRSSISSPTLAAVSSVM